MGMGEHPAFADHPPVSNGRPRSNPLGAWVKSGLGVEGAVAGMHGPGWAGMQAWGRSPGGTPTNGGGRARGAFAWQTRWGGMPAQGWVGVTPVGVDPIGAYHRRAG